MGFSSQDTLLPPDRRRRQSGQGTVEVILLLVVSVLLIMGAVYQMNDAFRVWANGYFGEYLSCLIETGELPAISGTGGSSSSCNQEFQAFSLTNGRPRVGKAIDPNGEGGESRSRGATGGSSNAGYVRAGGSGGGSGFGFGSFDEQSQKDKEGGGSRRGRKSPYTGSTDVSTPGGLKSREASGPGGRRGGTDSGFYVTRNEQELGEEVSRNPQIQISQSRKTGAAPIKVTRKPTQTELPESKVETFGDFLRYFIIIALVIIIVIVIGSQLFQISKELD